MPAELLNATHFDLTSADPGPRFQTTTAATQATQGGEITQLKASSYQAGRALV